MPALSLEHKNIRALPNDDQVDILGFRVNGLALFELIQVRDLDAVIPFEVNVPVSPITKGFVLGRPASAQRHPKLQDWHNTSPNRA